MPFLFVGFASYPFAGINHSHEYDCVLSPVDPSSKSSVCRGLGVLDIEEQLLQK